MFSDFPWSQKSGIAQNRSCQRKCVFYLPVTNSVCVGLFSKKAYFSKNPPFSQALQNTVFQVYLFRLYFFSLSFSNIKRQKQNSIYLKTLFVDTPTTRKKLVWHPYIPLVILKTPKQRFKIGEICKANLGDQFFTFDLDQLLTYESTNLGLVFDSTAYTCML